MKTTKAQHNGNKWKAKAWILEHPVIPYDPERVAAEDAMDADWHEAVRQARAKVRAEWAGDPNDVVGKLQAEMPLIPPWPPGFEERQRKCNRCGLPWEYNPDYDASFCRRCNRWLEAGCRDPNCSFCANRPAKPVPDR